MVEGARPVRSVVIVGGGTAGWITAGVLAARLRPDHRDGIKVTLIESADVPIIGVGEGTWPTIRTTLKSMRVSETEFLRACDASFKQASKFIDWLRPGHSYYHPFAPPRGSGELDLAPAWIAAPEGLSFADAVSFQPALCDQDRAPKAAGAPDYQSLANHAYHLDAGKCAAFLKAHCTGRLGVRHVVGAVGAIASDEDGYITSVAVEGQGDIGGDLFVDCTGFSALLIGRHFDVPLKNVRDRLFVDTALAIQVPYDTPDAPIASATLSTGQAAGWIWDIGLPSRRGVGYVYSSAFASEDEARATLATYPGVTPERAEQARKLAINSGYRERPWVKNCAAIGLSMGFVEPLEASSIVMIELAAQMLADQMPVDRAGMATLEARYNARFSHYWAAIVDFLKLHYALSERPEPFWHANRAPDTVGEGLRQLLDIWKTRPPGNDDFPLRSEIFPAASYQYVLYGMEYQTQLPAWAMLNYDCAGAARLRADVERARRSIGQLPTNRDLLSRITELSTS